MTIINIAEKSAPIGRAKESMPYGIDQDIPAPSNTYPGNASFFKSSKTEGRNQDLLNVVFPIEALGLVGYDPAALYKSMLEGKSAEGKILALGEKPELGAERYMGENYGTIHLTHENAPNLSTDVNIEKLNIPNAYIPDVSIGQAKAGDYAESLISRFPGIRNSFPTQGIETGLDLNAGDAPESGNNLSPSTTVNRLGQWTKDTLTFGRWKAE